MQGTVDAEYIERAQEIESLISTISKRLQKIEAQIQAQEAKLPQPSPPAIEQKPPAVALKPQAEIAANGTNGEEANNEISELERWERRLAYVERIRALEPIPGADVIEVATIVGWKVVVKKGKYQVGDHIVYAEIDSILPPWPTLIEDKLDKVNFRIKTVKLRGQISQGYCIPLKALTEHPARKVELITTKVNGVDTPTIHDLETNEFIPLEIEKDLTDFIGIQKYERPNAVNFKGTGKVFPKFIPKTDQIRIQNLAEKVEAWSDIPFEVTEKLEGSSITAFFFKEEFGICTRNLQLDLDSTDNVVVQTLRKLELEEKLRQLGKSLALQGELIGKGIQGNIYKLPEYEWRIFDIFFIESKRYATPEERLQILQELGLSRKHHVPILESQKMITGLKVADFLKLAEGTSALRGNCQREGLVFKSHSLVGGVPVSFKAISNTYLLKNEM